ncbi:MAG: Tfp pilus assembly protein FimT/FimU, partial [Candidatus Binatia bacterium]
SLYAWGFTLIEILVALAIFGILAAIAIPNWATLIPSYRLNSSGRQLQSELHKTKSRAVSENTRFHLVFSATSYRIERYNGTGYLPTGETKPLPPGISIESMSTSNLGFTARGTATPGTGGTVKLCNSKGAGMNVVVSSTGRIRVCHPEFCNGKC